MKAGNKAYFVQSLLLPAIPCRILQIEDYNGNLKDRAFVRAELADDTIANDYSTKFTARKPAVYNTSIHYDNTAFV